jgi:hypothetical protein
MIIIDQLVWVGTNKHKVWAAHADDMETDWAYSNAAVWENPRGELVFVHYHKQDYVTDNEELRFCMFDEEEDVPNEMFEGREIKFSVTALTTIKPHHIGATTYKAIYSYLSTKWTVDHEKGGEGEHGKRSKN